MKHKYGKSYSATQNLIEGICGILVFHFKVFTLSNKAIRPEMMDKSILITILVFHALYFV